MKWIRGFPLLLIGLHAQWDFDILHRSERLYDETREKTIEIYRKTLDSLTDDNLSVKALRERHFKEAWNRSLDDIAEAAKVAQQVRTLPESAWLGRDKKDAREDLHTLFERIVEALVGQSLREEQAKLADIKRRISENNEKIAHYKEAKIGAPLKSVVYTTKSEYDAKIAALQEENKALQRDIDYVKKRFADYFAQAGISLSPEQVDVLLTRVDGEDLIRLTSVMDTLGYITRQLGELMKESGESLEQAKRYYAMHEVLLELALYLQRHYVERCDEVYLTKLFDIEKRTEETIEKTLSLIKEEEEPARREVYERNLEALRLTLETAKRYEVDLIRSRDAVKKAMQTTLKNLRAAQNTYETVMLSSELYDLISQNRTLFKKIGQIQLPDIIPFDNLQIKKRYNEITRKLR